MPSCAFTARSAFSFTRGGNFDSAVRCAWQAWAPGRSHAPASCAWLHRPKKCRVRSNRCPREWPVWRLPPHARARRSCAASRAPRRRCALSSACESCGTSTSSVGESTPPVAHVLITSAPYLILKRTAKRAWSGELMTPSSGPVSWLSNPNRRPAPSSQWPPRRPQRMHRHQHAWTGNHTGVDSIAQTRRPKNLPIPHRAQW